MGWDGAFVFGEARPFRVGPGRLDAESNQRAHRLPRSIRTAHHYSALTKCCVKYPPIMVTRASGRNYAAVFLRMPAQRQKKVEWGTGI